jgi:peptidoglycan-N-acetylglucosamine deacetylase
MIKQFAMVLLLGLAIGGCTGSEEALEEGQLIEGEGKADRLECSGIRPPDSSGFEKRVAITLDDGPKAQTTPLILDVLKAFDIRVTFFVVGRMAATEDGRQIAKRAVKEGHLLGNHSFAHPNMAGLKSAQLARELLDTDQLIREIIQGARQEISSATLLALAPNASDEEKEAALQDALSDIQTEPRFFRFPGGNSSCAAAKYVRSQGYAVTGWNFGPFDYCYNAGNGVCKGKRADQIQPARLRKDMIALTLRQAKQADGGILLLHDSKNYTAKTLRLLITTLLADGFSFVNLDDESTFPRLNGIIPPFVGDACDSDAICAFGFEDEEGSCLRYKAPVSDASPEVEQEIFGHCSLSCEGRCPDQIFSAPTFCASLDKGLTGNCLSLSDEANDYCAGLPGTKAAKVARHLGKSSASKKKAVVCKPVDLAPTIVSD